LVLATQEQAALPDGALALVALEVGIVGLPNAGKTTLFNVLTGARATVSGNENVGMAVVADERLGKVAAVVDAGKVTPAAIRVVDVPGSGAQLLGNLRQVDALLLVLDGWSGTRVPEDDRVTFGLELLLADREHVGRRLERVAKQAKSGEPALREEAALLERLAAHLDAGETVASFPEPVPAELEPLTAKPLLEVVNGPEGVDLKLETELSELEEQEASAFREGASALEEVVRRLFAALDLVSFFTAREKETRAWTLRRGQTALDAAAAVHTDIAQGFIRAEVIRWDDLVACGSHAEAASRGLQRLEGKGYVVQDGDVLNIRFSPPR
jgi:ribosome-binding ATPase